MYEFLLSDPLHDYLNRFCDRNFCACSVERCAEGSDCQSESVHFAIGSALDDEHAFDRLRASLRSLECRECSLLLVLDAIDRTVPRERQALWLDAPNLDLRGRTPRECLDVEDWDSVINALWLYENSDYICS
jgi:hypothetical protein